MCVISGLQRGGAAGRRGSAHLAQHYGFLRLVEFNVLRVLLQFYYDLNLCGLKQSCQSRVMIERDEFIRSIESDGNDGTIESDGNDEFIESMVPMSRYD